MTTKYHSLSNNFVGSVAVKESLRQGFSDIDAILPRFNVKSSSVVLTDSATLQNVAGAVIPIAANETLLIALRMPVGSLLASTGIKVAVDVPALASLEADFFLDAKTSSSTIRLFDRTTVDAAAVTFAAASLTGATVGFISGYVAVFNGANAGNVQFMAAPATTGAALSVFKGTSVVAQKLA